MPLKADGSPVAAASSPLYRLFCQVFLPAGYPDSVSSDYASYQIWDTIQAFCSTISGTLTTHAILRGIGVGNESATALSATATWVLKEGAGHCGRIVFAWARGTQLDLDSKKWRLRADVLNDVAMFVEIFVLPHFVEHSTYVLCGTTTLKAIVGVAGGATRAALTQHHAIRGNMADVAAKDGAQETCVNLVASMLGLFLLTAVRTQTVLYAVFAMVTLAHVLANWRAVRAVCLRTFNESRLLIALEEFFKTGRMLSVAEVNRLERVTVGQTVSLSMRVRIGMSAKNLTDYFRTAVDLENVMQSFDPHDRFVFAESRRFLGIYLHCEANATDVLKAYFFAVSYLQDRGQFRDRYWDVQTKWNEFLVAASKEGEWMSCFVSFRVFKYVFYLFVRRLADWDAFTVCR